MSHPSIDLQRRLLLGGAVVGLAAAELGLMGVANAASPALPAFGPLRQIRAGELDVGYVEMGPADGVPVLLMHGFPYDIHAYAEVAPMLADKGCRVIVPYLRGYGATRFLSDTTPRSGEQAALGADLLALLDALRIQRAVLAGYD